MRFPRFHRLPSRRSNHSNDPNVYESLAANPRFCKANRPRRELLFNDAHRIAAEHNVWYSVAIAYAVECFVRIATLGKAESWYVKEHIGERCTSETVWRGVFTGVLGVDNQHCQFGAVELIGMDRLFVLLGQHVDRKDELQVDVIRGNSSINALRALAIGASRPAVFALIDGVE
jgi:hypothetical protein